MAVEDKYANANVAAGKLGNPALMMGAVVHALTAIEEIAAADSDGSVYRLATLPSNAIIKDMIVNCDAITSGTDFDLGLYTTGVGGAVVNKDLFLEGQSLASALVVGSGVSGMTALDIADLGKKIYEHAGDTIKTKVEGYDLALTGNTVGSAAGTVTVRVEYILG